ncbi:hypothetical protein HRI_004073800 [Hibiscus trionum]|uniref:Agglutinin domain-containing protein n=1 Tax=Hibiscus trionum TaxID=183268 RepID=A0A9W7MNR8_HIBTR|nr:hypothetical protein HRI_004073800 [Hibiscus trionum]
MASAMILNLPRFVALKGDNNRYLCLSPLQGRPYLRFVAEEISDPTATMEILVADDGNVSIKQSSSDKFWRLADTKFILADVDDTGNGNTNTLFRPFKVDSQSIALLSSANNLFCTRYSLDPPYPDSLNANADDTNFWAPLRVEEPVKTRVISNIVYDLDKSSIYDTNSVVLATNSAINTSGDASRTVAVKLPYEDVKTTIWKTKLSLKLEAKATFETSTFPVIVDGGKVGFSGQARRRNELDETMTTTTLLEDAHSVVVPPKTTAVVSLIATKGMCDIPFTFTQSDTLYNGETYTTEVQGNTYTISNFYDFKFQTKLEPADA